MTSKDLNAYMIAALIKLAGGVNGIQSDKTYTLNADIQFDVKDGKIESLGIISICLTEKPKHEVLINDE